eukprot:403353252
MHNQSQQMQQQSQDTFSPHRYSTNQSNQSNISSNSNQNGLRPWNGNQQQKKASQSTQQSPATAPSNQKGNNLKSLSSYITNVGVGIRQSQLAKDNFASVKDKMGSQSSRGSIRQVRGEKKEDQGVSMNDLEDLGKANKKVRQYEIEIIKYKSHSKSNQNSEAIIEQQRIEIEQITNRLMISENARAKLQEIINSRQSSQDSKSHYESLFETINKENQEFRHIILQKDQSQNDFEKKEIKIQLENYHSKNTSYETSFFESEKKRVSLQDEIEKSLDLNQLKLNQQYQIVEQLTHENEKLKARIRELESQVSQLTENQVHTLNMLMQEKNKVKVIKDQQIIITDLKDQRDLLMKQLESMRAQQQNSDKRYQELLEQLEIMNIKFKEELDRYLSKIDELNQLLRDKEEELLDKETYLKELEQLQLSMKDDMRELSNQVWAQSDLQDQLKESQDENSMLRAQIQSLHQNLLESNKLLETNHMHLQDQKLLDRIKELESQLQVKQTEIDKLNSSLDEWKHSKDIYVPEKSCAIDSELASFINNYSDRSKLRIMFMRESEGVYQFGSRRVYVKVERDKIMIRVGGGYLSIDEFIDIYTPMELDRVDRNDPLKRFSEKVAVQKTLSFNSPLRSPARAGSQNRQTLNGLRNSETSQTRQNLNIINQNGYH